MTIFHLFSLLGGLGLFLYGMWMMREHLKDAAGNRLQGILEHLTATRFRGFFAGVVITAAVQSSSAVLVLLVGLTEAGILTLTQAVWVILGANVGTTVTGQVIALNMEGIAPLFAFVGIMLLLFAKKELQKHWGGIFSGMGVLFIGLSMMGEAVMPLEQEQWFLRLLTACRHPAAGILAGTVVTAILQSSSASVGILQTLAKSGLIDLGQSIYIVFGQNIGTCATALIASAGAKRTARQTAVIHLMVNGVGAALFVALVQILPFCEWMERLSPADPVRQIANVHTTFNVVTSLLLLPFGGVLVRLSEYLTGGTDEKGRKERLLRHDRKKG